MTTLLILLASHVAAFVVGMLVHRNNVRKAAQIEAKARAAVDAIRQ